MSDFETSSTKPLTYAQLKDLVDDLRRDVGTLKSVLAETQDRIRNLITSLPMGLVVVTEDGLIEALNDRACAIFACRSEEMVGKALNTIFVEKISPGELLEELSDSSLSSNSHKPCKLLARRKGEETFVAEVLVNRFDMFAEKRLFINVQDVSERHALEQLRQDLVNMVSHDLRAPLTTVKLILDGIEAGTLSVESERGLRALRGAQTSADYMSNMVTNLLDADRAESGSIILDLRETSVGEIVRTAVGLAESSKTQSSVELVPEYTNDVIVADRDRLVQVLLNLLNNALKFSPDKSIVRIEAGMVGLECKFTVDDQGPGIAPEDTSLIFERYRQLGNIEDMRRSGFGLGLAICKALIELHGGKIWVDRKPAGGSRFSFSIPLLNEDS